MDRQSRSQVHGGFRHVLGLNVGVLVLLISFHVCT